LRLEGDSLRQRHSRKLHLVMCVWTSCGAQHIGSKRTAQSAAHLLYVVTSELP